MEHRQKSLHNMATDIVKVIDAAGFVAVPVLAAWVGLELVFQRKTGRAHARFSLRLLESNQEFVTAIFV